MSDDIYQDWRETPFKVGDLVKFGVDNDAIGTISRITDVDGDYNDDTGRGEMIPPRAFVKYEGIEEEDYCDGSAVGTFEQFVWQFDDIEVV